MSLKEKDYEVYSIIEKERDRQKYNIELIASENYASDAVMEAQGSIFTNKYAEGYPGKRYYGGCENADLLESLAIERLCRLFHVKYANVQAHSGSSANMAAYRALIKNGDRVMGMALDQGGHLTHGSKVSFSGQDYEFMPYYVSKDTEEIDYEELRSKAIEFKPQLIVAGASAYSRFIDFKKIREICDEVGCFMMVDMAHIAGLVAAGLHQNPCDYADIVTSTTHKTLRGPRGGIILTNNEDIIKKVNKAIFPGCQGGPLLHVIAAKAVCFKEALSDDFKEYQRNVVNNCKYLCELMKNKGYVIVSNGTDNHLFTINVKKSLGISGKVAEATLDKVGITCNKNTVPYDPEKPGVTSGIRIGTAAVTTRGFKEKEIEYLADLIDSALRNYDNEEFLEKLHKEERKFMERF